MNRPKCVVLSSMTELYEAARFWEWFGSDQRSRDFIKRAVEVRFYNGVKCVN